MGYLHNLSPIKTSKSNNQYFDLQIQTSNEVYRTVCFSPDKHSLLKRKLESSSPIKIHKYQLKKNERSGENDLILNKRTKIEDPDDSETDFDYVSVKTETMQATDATTEEIQDGAAHTLINIMGRLTFSGSKETLQVKGKTLTKQEAILTDNTGSIRVVLWEKDIPRVTTGTCYNITNMAVKEYGVTKYLTLTRHSTIESIQVNIDRQDTSDVKTETTQHQFPPDGVNYVQQFLACNKCHSKLVNNASKIIKCSECGLTQLKKKCQSKVLASILIKTDQETASYTLFNDTMHQLFHIYEEQNPEIETTFEEMTEDDINVMLLTVEANVLFNEKRNAVQILKD